MKSVSSVATAVVVSLAALSAAHAAAIKAATVGCSSPGDASRLAALQGRDGTQTAAAQPFLANRACLSFAKGITVSVDETKAPLSCIRLSGDLSCYWVASSLVDEHPGEKASAAGKRSGRRGAR